MKVKKFLLFCAIIFSVSFFTSCGSRKAEQNEVNLGENWMYSLTDPFTNPEAHFDLLVDEYLSNLQVLVPGKKGSIWLKKTFSIPDSLTGKDISCYLGRITLADRTYINGQLIGHEGYFPPNEFTAWNTTRFYEIPEQLLTKNNNTLIVEVFVDGEGSIVSDPFIGLHEQTKKAAEKERFWNAKINLLFAFFMIIIAIYHIIIFCNDKSQQESIYFALVNIITALYMSVFYISELPFLHTEYWSFLFFQKVFSSAMPFVLVFMINSFVNAFLKRKEKLPFLIARIIFCAAPILVVLFMPDYIHLRESNSIIQAMLIPPLLYIVALLIIYSVKKNKEALKLVIGFAPFVIFGLIDFVVHNVLKIYQSPYIIMIGWQLVVIALLFILAQRFSNARRQSEYLNIHLQDEVEKQTKELSSSNAQLTSVVAELNDAKEKSEKDMKMAVYVQQSIYQHLPPFVDGWDIAFKFIPKNGISGDLYDFYTEGNELKGLSLFDVSGQGLPAGLVALLSKSLVEEQFKKNKEEHLSAVMKKISESIAERKGNVENYLKGLLLRITGNKVEYVSGGNPTIYLRSAKSGKCSPVELRNSAEETEKIIGTIAANPEFKVIGFNMSAGDSLILYTEPFAKSRNEHGDEYSKNRIATVFAESGNGNAQSKLNAVMTDYQTFKSDFAQDGDITVIVLQKL